MDDGREIGADAMRALLEGSAPLLRQIRDQNRNTAAGFNVFEASGINTRELSHSAFLASLLDPLGTHQQEQMFLKCFLDEFLGSQANDLDCRSAAVITEFPIPPHGRLDILVILRDGTIVIIENKVRAMERDKQLADYKNWLENKKPRPPGHHLIFLTPDGRAPETVDAISAEKSVVCVSYGKLAEWLERVAKEIPYEATGLQEVIKQYIACCQEIGGVMKTGDDENIIDYLRHPDRVRVTLELEQCVAALKEAIAQDFWSNVRDYLQRDINYKDNLWCISLDERIIGKDTGLRIRSLERTQADAYTFVLLGVTHDVRHHCYVGIERPWPGRYIVREKLEKSLRKLLIEAGIKKVDNWAIRWGRAHEIGLSEAASPDVDTLESLENDNRCSAREHPKAERVAAAIGALFGPLSKTLLDLNNEIKNL